MIAKKARMGRISKILFVTVSDFSEVTGGSVATAEMVAAFGRNESIELSVVCAEPPDEIPSKVAENVDEFYYFSGDSEGTVLGHIKEQANMAPVLRRAIKKEDLDAVVSRYSATSVTPPLLTKAYGKPHILLIRGLAHDRMRYGYILKKIFWMNVRLADRLYVAFKEIKKETKKVRKPSQTEAEYFTNAVDPEEFSPTSLEKARKSLELGLEKDDFVIGFVGSLKDRHMIEKLLLTVSNLNDVNALIVGDGPERGRLEELVRKEGIEERVTFTGNVKHSEVDRYISACDIMYGVVHPDIPSNPIKCYEYLASERPVITSNKREFEFVSRIEVGKTIDTIKMDEVRSAIQDLRSLTREEILNMGKRGREYVLENHTWDELPRMVLGDIEDIGI
ncbi:glycosyltransferase family 4 protein [Halonotius sp. F2-221B]|uniref:glycosyltransferase family 4 protein n=1 Tax=Halonotius sp. F2-221B TaxID=2731620 RepID=UPI00398A907B